MGRGDECGAAQGAHNESVKTLILPLPQTPLPPWTSALFSFPETVIDITVTLTARRVRHQREATASGSGRSRYTPVWEEGGEESGEAWIK